MIEFKKDKLQIEIFTGGSANSFANPAEAWCGIQFGLLTCLESYETEGGDTNGRNQVVTRNLAILLQELVPHQEDIEKILAYDAMMQQSGQALPIAS